VSVTSWYCFPMAERIKLGFFGREACLDLFYSVLYRNSGISMNECKIPSGILSQTMDLRNILHSNVTKCYKQVNVIGLLFTLLGSSGHGRVLSTVH